MMRAHQWLLRLYPASFRNEYGSEMTAIFARRLHDAGNPLARAAVWTAAVAETIGNALLVHLDIARQDAAYVARTWRRAPGFAATTTAIVALGIGATTAAFTVTDYALLRPLPFTDPDRLVAIWEKPTGYTRMELSPANYRDWHAAATSFDDWAAFSELTLNLVGVGEPQRVDMSGVSANLFPTLGVRPLIGRGFAGADDRDGAPGTAVLSYRLWQTTFGGAGDIIGRHVRLDDESFEVVGVMPPTFRFPNADVQLWVPLRLGGDSYQDRSNTYLQSVARLRRGVSVDAARGELELIASRSRLQYPKENEGIDVSVFTLADEVQRGWRPLVAAVTGSALCVLLIACANVANLLLARALERRRELAVRSALGAGRERLARQLLTESLALAGLGGIVGTAMAAAAVPLLARLLPSSLPIAGSPQLDLRVLAFTAVVSIATGLAFGIAPVLRLDQRRADALTSGVRAGGGAKEGTRSALVAAEIAASVILLIVAGLLLRSLWTIQAIDPGFRADGVLTLRTSLPFPQYEKTAARDGFYSRVLADVRALPGVAHAAYASVAPLASRGGVWPVSIDGRPVPPTANQVALLRYVTPDYFGTLGIPIRSGRDIADADDRNHPFVAVVSESFVRRYFPDRDPIGRHFTFAFADRTIVGVAADIRARGLERESEPQVYLSAKQVPDDAITFWAPKDLLVRMQSPEADPLSLVPAVRAIVRRVDPEQPVSDVRTERDILDRQTASRAVQLRVIAAFAVISFVLAAIGIHGVLGFAVAQRTQEIGVRMALGAKPLDIVSMIVRRSVVLGGIGIAAGVAIGYAAGRSMQAILTGVTPGDVWTFGSAVALAAVMTMAGTLVPTLRALQVDPILAIRTE